MANQLDSSLQTKYRTRHPEYGARKKLWDIMDDFMSDESVVKGKGVTYLPATSGMDLNTTRGKNDYNAYQMRARVPDITRQGQTGIVGLVFEKDPVGSTDEVITRTGQTNTDLARECIRGVSEKGRYILVVDAPKEGGTPYISQYEAPAGINWKVTDNPNELRLAVIEEQIDDDDDYAHTTTCKYRHYKKKNGVVTLEVRDEADEIIEPEKVLVGLNEIPVIFVGSIDISPKLDPIMLLPVARCAHAYYLSSANYKHAIYMTTQPTPYGAGMEKPLAEAIKNSGIGSSSFWYLGQQPEANVGYLETQGNGIEANFRDMQEELRQAESYAVRLTQAADTGGVESAAAIALRGATQHASIYSAADAVSQAINKAQMMRAEWGGLPKPEKYRIQTEFGGQYASEQMINALNTGVNDFNIPQSVLFQALRISGLTEASDEELMEEIADKQRELGGVGGADPIAVARALNNRRAGGNRTGLQPNDADDGTTEE